MKKKYSLLVIIFCFYFSGHSQTIFFEDFEGTGGTFPTGWTLFNVDGLTPSASVSYMTNAWIVRAHPNNAANIMATSTSWYTPAGVSNDWMMSPPITLANNSVLSWDAYSPDVAFPDGYEVRISTTTADIAASSVILFSTAAENSTITNRSVDLSAYSGQTVYISWRNNSNDKFLLLVDNIKVIATLSYDSNISATTSNEYSRIPFSQVGNLNSNITVSNLGTNAMTNLVVTLNVYDLASTLVYTENSTPIASLASGANQTVNLVGYTPTTSGNYTFTHVLTSTETDAYLLNNTISYSKEIENTYARDNNIITGSLGIGEGTSGQLGQEFEIVNSTNIVSVSFILNNTDGTLTGTTTYATIWNMVAGVPYAIIAQTVPVTIVSTVNNLYTANIVGGTFTLNPGTYLIAIEEGTLYIQVANTDAIFTPGTVWVNWPTIPTGSWANVETFGATFAKSLVIRPNFMDILSTDNNQLNTDSITLYPNPAKNNVRILNNSELNLINATIYDISGRIVSFYSLNNNSVNDLDISKISAGNYIINIQSESGVITKKMIIN
ncbi:T9SS-dependent choice-of-anchor J family protein [Flavobacterium psychraquaticum]|uniref:T9SS-dependent choice-of-anchor J family protein n=1 Tax=Flavobacterium psychraquaticum TaxID=3103958 RepID=UPI002ACDA004|nr:choice-of-anchor J domain-containing protein [Flavobacterium sp. LB-N7T]